MVCAHVGVRGNNTRNFALHPHIFQRMSDLCGKHSQVKSLASAAQWLDYHGHSGVFGKHITVALFCFFCTKQYI